MSRRRRRDVAAVAWLCERVRRATGLSKSAIGSGLLLAFVVALMIWAW